MAHAFTVTDNKGNVHQYQVTPHMGEEAVDISLWMLANLGGMLSGGLDSSLDFSAIRTALLAPDAKPILLSLFRYTIRDAQNVLPNFSIVYQGNIGEAFKAIPEVMKANGFFGLLDIFGLVSSAGATIPSLSPLAPASPPPATMG